MRDSPPNSSVRSLDSSVDPSRSSTDGISDGDDQQSSGEFDGQLHSSSDPPPRPIFERAPGAGSQFSRLIAGGRSREKGDTVSVKEFFVSPQLPRGDVRKAGFDVSPQLPKTGGANNGLPPAIAEMFDDLGRTLGGLAESAAKAAKKGRQAVGDPGVSERELIKQRQAEFMSSYLQRNRVDEPESEAQDSERNEVEKP